MSCDWEECPTCNKLIWAYKLGPEQVNYLGGFCVCKEYPEYEHLRYPHDKTGWCAITMRELAGHPNKPTVKEDCIRKIKETKL